jgi:hypothetical protein
MKRQIKYPFKLANVFFGRVEIERAAKMPEKEMEINFEVQGKIVENQLPDMVEVHLKIASPDEQSVKFDLIIIGKFVLIEGATEPDSGTIQDFVNERALHILWSYVDQMVSLVSAQMAMKPIRLPPPIEFYIERSSSPA